MIRSFVLGLAEALIFRLVGALISSLPGALVHGLICALSIELVGGVPSPELMIHAAWIQLVLRVPKIASDQEIAGRNQVRNPHAFLPVIADRLGNIPSQRYRILKCRREWKDSQQISVRERLLQTLRVQRELFDLANVMVIDPFQQRPIGRGQTGQSSR